MRLIWFAPLLQVPNINRKYVILLRCIGDDFTRSNDIANTLAKGGPEIAAGVPALRDSNRDLVLALKSGNFGGTDFFNDALNVLLEHYKFKNILIKQTIFAFNRDKPF